MELEKEEMACRFDGRTCETSVLDRTQAPSKFKGDRVAPRWSQGYDDDNSATSAMTTYTKNRLRDQARCLFEPER